ncbi:MAG TPA: hypothetical protein VFP61_07530 [Acidimicrobiales bacterium]|nr:hypothetical protein [Acidimicrobiales bacterium]
MRLLLAVERRTGGPAPEPYRSQLVAIADDAGEHLVELLEAAGQLNGVRTAKLAAALLAQRLAMLRAEPAAVGAVVDPAARVVGLRRMIAVYDAEAPDDPRLAELRAELASLEPDTPCG